MRYAPATFGSKAHGSSRTSTNTCSSGNLPHSSKRASCLLLSIPKCERYLEGRLARIEEQLGIVDRLAQANELPDAILTD